MTLVLPSHIVFEQTLPSFWTALCFPFSLCWNLSDLTRPTLGSLPPCLCLEIPSSFFAFPNTILRVMAAISAHSVLTYLPLSWLCHVHKLPEGMHLYMLIMLGKKAVHKESFNQGSLNKTSCRISIKISHKFCFGFLTSSRWLLLNPPSIN